MTMHKALHPRDDINRLYMSWKEGGRGLASVDASRQGFKDSIKKSKEIQITAASNSISNIRTNSQNNKN